MKTETTLSPLAPVDTTLVPSASIGHDITVFSDDGKTRTKIKIRLNDECKNGHEYFSITADIDEKDGRGIWRDSMGGCCHEHILALRPDLAPFVALHLSDCTGVPMHAIANAWYWFQGAFPESADTSPNLGACHGGTGSSGRPPAECLRILKEHIRADDTLVEAIRADLPRSQKELQFSLEQLGFPQRWKNQAIAAVAELERLTGRKFESRQTRVTWQPLTDAEKADIQHKRAIGFYNPENVAQRDKEKREAAKAKKLAAIEKDLNASIQKIRDKAAVESFLVRHDQKKNAIYYDHKNTVTVNWCNFETKYTPAEFGELKTLAFNHADELPAGITFEWQEKPRY